mmetsp:Transcript_8925/g.26539  ORF Transcript_8925/g.26539 Transcript_8925/m.26539 type:complete len:286 (-) Transcript_8925:127-984(-)
MVVLDGSRVGTLAVEKDLGPVRVVFVSVSPLSCPLRKELANGLWVKDVSRQDVCADLGSLVNDADREFLVVFEAELLGANGRRQSRGSSPDDQNVKGHALTGFQQFGGNPDVFVAVAVGFTVAVVRRRRSGRKRSELGVDGAGVGSETVVKRAIRFRFRIRIRFRIRSRRRPPRGEGSSSGAGGFRIAMMMMMVVVVMMMMLVVVVVIVIVGSFRKRCGNGCPGGGGGGEHPTRRHGRNGKGSRSGSGCGCGSCQPPADGGCGNCANHLVFVDIYCSVGWILRVC